MAAVCFSAIHRMLWLSLVKIQDAMCRSWLACLLSLLDETTTLRSRSGIDKSYLTLVCRLSLLACVASEEDVETCAAAVE